MLTCRIKGEARRLGFSEVGIAPASALNARDVQMQNWLNKGFSGGLIYMQNFFQRRQNLLARHPGVQSIVVLAVSYRQPPGAAASDSQGKIAQYARGPDYHRKIHNQLKSLMTFIQAQAGRPVSLLATVDTSPVQERALAEAAGLGFFGKNSCLIRPKGGSFFFLASLLTDLPLVPDAPLSWDCGACTLCLQACPTGALPEPYQLDASRCISALTIENRSGIPLPLRSSVGHWIFGCDLCQKACPYNRASSSAPPEEEGAGERLALREILTLRTEEAFRARFAGTPLLRAKREGLLRNAAIAAGNSRNPELIPAVADAAQHDPSPLVREHASWALGLLANPAK